MAIDAVVASPDARKEGFGQVVPGRLALMASQVSDAFATKTRVNPDTVWNIAQNALPGLLSAVQTLLDEPDN